MSCIIIMNIDDLLFNEIVNNLCHSQKDIKLDLFLYIFDIA